MTNGTTLYVTTLRRTINAKPNNFKTTFWIE